jgi:HEPN domain-containing protein
MDMETKLVYDNIYTNAVMFLRRAIKELITSSGDHLEREQAVIACIFIQMAVELGFKAYLIKTKSLTSILRDKHKKQTIEELLEEFEDGTLQTKTFEELKRMIVADDQLFDEERLEYINDFQRYRNQAVHFHLRLVQGDLFDLRYDLVYVLVHVVIPVLAEISLDIESPSDFYQECLDKNDYLTLIKFEPYVYEMKKVAEQHSQFVYHCIECNEKTYSVDNEICYCCNLQFVNAGEYVKCPACKTPKSVIFDHNNIAINENVMNGLCLNCGERCKVFKCPSCEVATPFYYEIDLQDTCYSNRCEMES